MALKNRPRRRFKTKKTVSGGPRPYYHRWADWNEGDYVIGEFVKSIKDNYDNKCPVLKVLDANFSNPVKDKEGNKVDIIDKHLQVNSAGSISYAFYREDADNDKEPIKVGEVVQILYSGQMAKEDWKGDGQPPHQMEVDILEEEEIEEGEENESEEDDDGVF
jgi:hypothetical protein